MLAFYFCRVFRVSALNVEPPLRIISRSNISWSVGKGWVGNSSSTGAEWVFANWKIDLMGLAAARTSFGTRSLVFSSKTVRIQKLKACELPAYTRSLGVCICTFDEFKVSQQCERRSFKAATPRRFASPYGWNWWKPDLSVGVVCCVTRVIKEFSIFMHLGAENVLVSVNSVTMSESDLLQVPISP